jgi:exonuclease III
LKIVTWNCNGAFRKKFTLLESFDADIYIIQECENPADSTHEYRTWAGEYLWIGDSKHKGLGVFAKKEHSLTRMDKSGRFAPSGNPKDVVFDSAGLKSFLPCRVNDTFNLLAVWTKQNGSPTFGYIGQMWLYWQIHHTWLSNETSVICGDFNSNAIWDTPDRWWNHSNVVQGFEGAGLSSAYHDFFGVIQGEEPHPTLYHQKKLQKPFHIDYCFLPQNVSSLKSVTVGSADEWLAFSDHMPLVVEFEL